MIQFQQVQKNYPGSNFSLGEISFQIDEGEFVFLIGPSGSGKTSLIKLLIREENLSNGKIFLDDQDITNLSRNKVYKLRRQLGVIFQDYKLIAHKNAYENVAFAMEAAGKKTKDISETVPYVLDIVGLSDRAGAFPHQLSGGEKQRVAIARAVANNPRVLIADEPTGNLDPAAAWDIVQILSKINNWGTTVVMSTHGSDIVNTLNKRVIQMKDGLLVRDDSQGYYERTDFIPESLQKVGAELESTRKGPIKVKLQAESSVEAEPKQKGLFSWFRGGNIELGAKQIQGIESPEVRAELAGEVEAAQAQEVEIDTQNLDNETAEKILVDADRISLDKLDLRSEIVADLNSAGYLDVEDILSAGPEKLADELIIDPEEVLLIAKAISEFVEEEMESVATYHLEAQALAEEPVTIVENEDEGQNSEKVEPEAESEPKKKASGKTLKAAKKKKTKKEVKLDLAGKPKSKSKSTKKSKETKL